MGDTLQYSPKLPAFFRRKKCRPHKEDGIFTARVERGLPN